MLRYFSLYKYKNFIYINIKGGEIPKPHFDVSLLSFSDVSLLSTFAVRY